MRRCAKDEIFDFTANAVRSGLVWLLVLLLLTGCWDRDGDIRVKPQDDPPVIPPPPEPEPEPEPEPDPDPETDPEPDPEPDPDPDPEPEPEPEPDPVHELDVYIDDTYGDRFRPVIVRVDYTVDGVGADFEFWVPYGRVEASSDGFYIYGDGQRHEDLVLTVNGEEFLYQLRPEPRCGKVDLEHDCLGYRYKGPPDGYIYYGDDDDTVVEWQLGYIYYDNTLEAGQFVQSDCSDRAWTEAEGMVQRMNGIYERYGVHIRLVLEPTAVGFGRYMNNGGHTSMTRQIGTADVSLGRGITCPDSGGCARVSTYFQENTGFTLAGTIARSNYLTGLHEIGHTVGLAHGPDNSAQANEGYIWPDFGHGYSTPMCGDQLTDLMSYSYQNSVHNNSRQVCGDGSPAGSREYADSAYHLNRVRYDVSMIGRAPDEPPAYIDDIPEQGPLILD